MFKFKIIIDGKEQIVECNSLQVVEMFDDNINVYLFDSEVEHELGHDDDEERGW